MEPDEEVLEDGIAFAGVAKFPSRVKCALLSWMAWKDATAQSLEARMADHGDLPEVPEAAGGGTATVRVDDVTEAMKDVVDPELGINVVDLGLVYGVHLDEAHNVVLDMTLTSAACPLTDVIRTRPTARSRVSSTTSPSTGSGCPRGAPTRSPPTAASSCAPWASTSDVVQAGAVGPDGRSRAPR